MHIQQRWSAAQSTSLYFLESSSSSVELPKLHCSFSLLCILLYFNTYTLIMVKFKYFCTRYIYSKQQKCEAFSIAPCQLWIRGLSWYTVLKIRTSLATTQESLSSAVTVSTSPAYYCRGPADDCRFSLVSCHHTAGSHLASEIFLEYRIEIK